MTIKAMTNLYPQLTGEERFRLAVEAKARQDTAELGRLATSCPRMSVTMGDPAYCLRLDAAFGICRTFGLFLLADLRVLAMVQCCLDRTDRCIALCIVEDKPPSEAASEIGAIDPKNPSRGQLELELWQASKVQNEVIRRTATRIKSCWTAFEGFCRDRWAVDPWTGVRAYCSSVVVAWEDVAETLQAAEVDAEKVKFYREGLDLMLTRLFQLPAGYQTGAATPPPR